VTAAERIYLDNAATTPVRPEAVEAMLPFFSANGYNASSAHAEGRAARAALDDARDRIARCIGAKSKEIVFTGGGWHPANLAPPGGARARRARGRHLVSTAAEHHAVLHALDALRDDGRQVTLLPVDSQGRVWPEAFGRALNEDTILASVMYVNNEIGTVAPVAELAAIARAHGVLFHTDAVQAAAYLPIDVKVMGVDLLSLAAHKFYGPKGVGLLYVREGTPIVPILHGGSQEFAKRAGTENVAGIAGMTAALELAMDERTEAAARIATLRDRFEQRILARLADVRINGGGAMRAPHISNLSFLGVTSEQLLMRLDIDGVAVSAGSACASGAVEPSHVIAALGLPQEWMRGVIRFSLGRTTTQAQIDRAAEVLEQAVADLRSVSAAQA
jgi:cysteine desulfurase